MTKLKIGVLHPGAMGISVAASAKDAGHVVYWASEGRSRQTRTRAARFDLVDAQTLQQLCDDCSVIFSVCPPHAAAEKMGVIGLSIGTAIGLALDMR